MSKVARCTVRRLALLGLGWSCGLGRIDDAGFGGKGKAAARVSCMEFSLLKCLDWVTKGRKAGRAWLA